MGLTLEQALGLVRLLEEELDARSAEADEADDYYRGEHRLRFASEEFADYFADRYQGFRDNWCAVVADAPVERLAVQGFQPYGTGGPAGSDAELWRVWQANGLDADSKLGFLESVKSGRSFVRVWGDPLDAETPLVTFHAATEAVVGYEPGSRYRRRAALRRWQDGNTEHCCLYTPTELWKFTQPLARSDEEPGAAAVDEQERQWMPVEDGSEPNPQRNPMGLVPVVEIPNRPMLSARGLPGGDALSDVAAVIPMQDALNMIWALTFTAADFAAIAQRYVLGAEKPMAPIYASDGVTVVGERPVSLDDPAFKMARLLFFQGDDVEAGSWPAADLGGYLNLVDVAVSHVAAQSRTPPHYFVAKMSNMSSDAMVAAETGLAQRTKEKQLWGGVALREMARLTWLAKGDQSRAAAYRAGKVLWKDAEARSQAQLVASLVQLKGIGWPFEDLARRFGLTPAEVTQLMEMREEEAAQNPVLAALGTGGAQSGGLGNASSAEVPAESDGDVTPGDLGT